MVSSKSLRRLIAGTVAVLYLACQGATVVYARAVDSQQSSAAQGSCHEPAQPDSKTTGNSDCQANCQSQHNSSSPSFASIYAVTDLPAITVRVDNIVAAANSVLAAEPPLLRIQSPPLLALHSRLRN
jgi:hypothetical protein